jgi:menaquinone-dependent protoporphyrinogen IX oxidase
MRVAIVYVPSRDPAALAAMAKAMARAIESAGHRAEFFGSRDEEATRLTGFDYVIIGSEPIGLRGKLPDAVPSFLAQAGMLSGKRSMAFVRKSGLGASRCLSRLMSAMEAEGMLVNCSEIVSSEAEAAEAARSAPIERA